MPGWVVRIEHHAFETAGQRRAEEWLAFIADQKEAARAVLERAGGVEPRAVRRLDDAAFEILAMEPGDVLPITSARPGTA